MLRVVRIAGTSMSPTLEDGDFVLVFRRVALGRLHLFGAPRPGDVVLVDHRSLGAIVKRVERRARDGRVTLRGDHPLSTSSAHLGAVPLGAVVGRAWLRISPRARPARIARGRPSRRRDELVA